MVERVLTEDEIKGMLDESDREGWAEVLGDEPLDNEPDTLSEMDNEFSETEEGDDEPDEDEEDADDEPEEDVEEDGDDENIEDDDARVEDHERETEAPEAAPQGRAGPPSRLLREERAQRRAMENELANARARIAAYEVQQSHGQQRPGPQQAPRSEANAPPDIILDPEGWAAHQRAEIMHEIRAHHVNATLNAAHEEHGRDFEAAYKALTSLDRNDPMARAQVNRIWNAPNPGATLMKWHRQQRTLSEIGDDPDTWFERKLQERLSDPETRRQTLRSMRQEAMTGDGGRPRTQTRLPRSLNSASGSGASGRGRREVDPDGIDGSDAAMLEYAMR